MDEDERYRHGEFCWSDLATTDAGGAKRFYGGLFGWSFEDVEMSAGGVYSLCRLEGRNVAGLYAAQPDQPGCCWYAYVAVEDCDRAAAEAREAGGSVLSDPFDIPDVGRMGIVADPDGAVFCLWQRDSRHPGYARLGALPGTVCWNELASARPEAAIAFYGRLLGWKAWETAMPDFTYVEWLRDQQPAGGMLPLGAIGEGVPPHWLVYFAIADCDQAAADVHALGGKVVKEPFDVPDVGRMAVVQDPAGAVFAVIALIVAD